MADNYFTKLGKAIINKSQSGGTYPLQSHDTSSFKPFSSFFSWILGNQGGLEFNRYVEAFGDNPLVYMIVSKVAFTSASIKRIAVDDNDEEIENSVILDLLSEPNPDQSQIEFLEEIGESFSTTGNAYIRHIQGVGAGNELQILKSNRVEIVVDNIGEVTSYKWTRPDGKVQTIPAEEVLHIHTSNIVNIEKSEVKYGLSPLQAAWIVVQSSSEKLQAAASIFKNRGIIGIISSGKDTPMLPKERQRMQDEFDTESGGSDKFNKIKVSSTAVNFTQTGMSPTDLKLLEGILADLRLMCSIFGMPSVLFNDNESSTYNNVETAIKSAYLDSYIPLANKIDAKLSTFLSERLGVEETIKVDLNSIEVIKAVTNEVLQALNSMPDRLSVIAIQSLTDDEIREMLTIDALSNDQTTIGQASQTTTTDGGEATN